MILDRIGARASDAGLIISGIAPIETRDGLAPHLRTVILLSPDEPRFWTLFRSSEMARDGRPDPLDRWSRKVIGRMACGLGMQAKAVFPFGGPPWRPFIDWALRSGRCHSSPVSLLVHDLAGLFISFRGAIAVSEALAPVPSTSPCPDCSSPCRTACPVGALTSAGYDIPACHRHLDRLKQDAPDNQTDCRTGCLVRRACPVGQSRRRPEQSAHHMRHFHR